MDFLVALQKTMEEKCGHCAPLCEDIAYHYETTVADLQDREKLWLDPDPTPSNGVPSIPDW